MVFNSLTFVVFFACVLGMHSLPLPWTTKKINLLIASYLFYSAWNPPFVILLWVSTVVDWYAAQGLVKSRRQATRHAWMLLSVVANLGMLGYFKYGQFLLDNFTALISAIGIAYHPAHYDIVLPVGISFYTFATMSYTLDVYLHRAAPAESLLDYALFVTFFPHLVAGPIMRPTELVPQFSQPRRASADQLRFGLALMTIGLFNKVVLADSFLAGAAERVYDSSRIPDMLDAWAGTLAFSGQIFCDFAGYSSTAIGAALCLGFAMPDNFRFPYAAVGFSDFWRRWHITLSSWLRDYLYIPLGGNRHGARRTYMALMGTMLLGGLWHGANWTFVAWGGLHGIYLSVERALRARFSNYRPGPVVLVLLGLLTYTLVNITGVFFRAKTFAKAWQVLCGMGRQWDLDVRKLADSEADRNTHLWSKVVTDAAYRELARSIWRRNFAPSPGDPSPEEQRKTEKEQIDRMVKAVAKLRARGVKVLFVRMPSSGEFLAFENREYPRARTWDALLAATGAPGIYFEDYRQLQGYYLPEWSHMSRAEGERFTAAVYGIIARDFWPGKGAIPTR